MDIPILIFSVQCRYILQIRKYAGHRTRNRLNTYYLPAALQAMRHKIGYYLRVSTEEQAFVDSLLSRSIRDFCGLQN